MKKYLGIIKIETESFIGVNVRILTKFSDYKRVINKWAKSYPNAKKIIIKNDEVLNSFFKDFEDFKPVTEEEKKESQKLYDEIMKND